MENKRIVVLGATGAVGTYATMDLYSCGYKVIAVGHRSGDNGFFAQYGIPYYSVDIVNKNDFDKLPNNDIWAVVNLAGSLPANMSEYNPQLYIDSIMTGSLNVLDYCIKVGASRIVYAQSISDVIHLYGTKNPIPADVPMKFPLNNDHSVYAICKNASVNLIEHYYAKYGLKRFVLRFPNIYLYHPNKYYYVDCVKKWHSFRYLIDRAQKGLPLELWGNPDVVRDMVYVKDCTQIICKTIDANVNGGVYNVGTGIGTSMRSQIEGIIKVFSPQNSPSIIIERPDMPDSPEYIMDISKTVSELGYIPKYMYIDYLKDMKVTMEITPFKLLWGV
ncbi:MAG: NAD(P)-dependent oxidoreductase [Bacteroidales bacterium]|nr:NAD(P)-dependent oxidoreductase [Bacteroidales bacterium]